MADVALRVARGDAQTFRDEREWDVWCAFANADLRARNHIGPIDATAPTLAIVVTGIATAEAFGTALLTLGIVVTGIPTGEAFGTGLMGLTIHMTGIPTGEAFGAGRASLYVEVNPEVGSSWKRIRRNRKW